MFEMVSRALPVLASVSVCGAVAAPSFSWPNERLDGERLATGIGVTDPLRLTLCGLPLALSATVSEALREPVAVGVNVMLIAQVAPASTLAPQLFVCAKSPAFAPPSPMLEMLSPALPVFWSVMTWAELAVPTLGELNVSADADRFTAGSGTGEGPPPPPPLPPQAAQAPATSSVIPNTKVVRVRPAATKLTKVAKASNPAKSQSHPTGDRKLGGAPALRDDETAAA